MILKGVTPWLCNNDFITKVLCMSSVTLILRLPFFISTKVKLQEIAIIR